MDLRPYVDSIQRQLAVAAEAGGDDARALADRLTAPLDAAVRLTLQEVLAAAADEITCELAPGSVELRLRAQGPEFVVTPPSEQASADFGEGAGEDPPAIWQVAPGALEGDEGAMARVNLRLPDQLKARVEQAASSEGLSVNAWLVRAAAAALEGSGPGRRRERRAPRGGQHYVGWGR
jgi:HicB family